MTRHLATLHYYQPPTRAVESLTNLCENSTPVDHTLAGGLARSLS